MVAQAFTPAAVARLRQQIRDIVDDLLDHLDGAGTMDLIAELAYPLPVLVIGALLGVPTADRAHFRTWSAALADGLDAASFPRPDAIARGNGAAEEMTTYLRFLLAERRTHPRDDLLSDLIAARDGADRLTEDELLSTALLLFFAVHETTVNLIGNGTLALLQHPDQLALLYAEPSLIGNAVEELLRFDSPVQRTFRVATRGFGCSQIPRRGDRTWSFAGCNACHSPQRKAEANASGPLSVSLGWGGTPG